MWVSSGEQILNPEFEVFGFILPPTSHPMTRTKITPNANFANFGVILIKLGLEVKNGELSLSPEEQSLSPDFEVVVVLPPRSPP